MAKMENSIEQRRTEILEEYKALRAEILLQIDHHRGEYLIIIPAIATILTLAITYKQPWFCLLAFFLNLYSWRHYRAVAFTVIKLGAYIAVFIEPETDGLRYERVTSKVDKLADPKSSMLQSDKFLDIITTPYAIISLASIMSLLYLINILSFLDWDFLHILLLAVIILIVHSAIIFQIFKKGTLKEREYWQNFFKRIKDNC